jgi:predicted glycosyltransferase
MPGHGAARPVLLFYCQHSLGIGHLTRSFTLARALQRHFQVVFLNGGRLPPGLPVPSGLERIDLPPLGMDDGHTLISRAADQDLAAARAERRRLIDAAVARCRPAVLLVELFPFGRKKFADEILPMLRAVRRRSGAPALVACSLRDILVDARRDQQHHDDRARWLADRYFDLVLVHSDPAFARLEQSFRPRRPLAVPVCHTGFVVPAHGHDPKTPRGPALLVSAGGGIVGEALLRGVLSARPFLPATLALRLVAGPFLPEPAWRALKAEAAGRPGVTLLRQVPDLVAELRRARASISQCGYNTALELLAAGVPAMVLPYETATENEQRQRAERLAALGALLCLERAPADGRAWAAEIERLLAFEPRPAALAVDGAERSAAELARRCAEHIGAPGRLAHALAPGLRPNAQATTSSLP